MHFDSKVKKEGQGQDSGTCYNHHAGIGSLESEVSWVSCDSCRGCERAEPGGVGNRPLVPLLASLFDDGPSSGPGPGSPCQEPMLGNWLYWCLRSGGVVESGGIEDGCC